MPGPTCACTPGSTATRHAPFGCAPASTAVLLDQHEQSLAGGLNEVDWTLDVNDPRLWWPWTLGDQELTDVEVEIFVDEVVSDSRTVRTGLREVVLHDWVFNGQRRADVRQGRQPGADTHGAGRRHPGRAAPRRGAGPRSRPRPRCASTVTSRRPELYDAADELGMLLWQDFPLQWGYAAHDPQGGRAPGPRGGRPARASSRRSPCGAPTTNRWPPNLDRSATMGKAAVQYIAGQQLPSWNKTVLDRWVKRAFEQADETRTTIAHSGVLPHLPMLDGTDSHLYFGWYHGDERDLRGIRRVDAADGAIRQRVRRPGGAACGRLHGTRALARPRLGACSAERHGLQLHAFDEFVPPAAYATFDEWRDGDAAVPGRPCCAITSRRCDG